MQKNFFVKSHGLGNDYIVLNSHYIDFPLTAQAIQLICDVHYGLGSDGILLHTPSATADAGLRIFNPDGSEAEKSGNGLRIFCKYLYDYEIITRRSFSVETKGGLVNADIVEEDDGKARVITIDMGTAVFDSRRIPVLNGNPECMGEKIQAGDKWYSIHCVSVGNPHCVILVDELDEREITTYGPLIENHPLFPNRINVQFAKVLLRNKVQVLIWERGAGYTLASGSSSCAVAAVTSRLGLTDPSLTIEMPGGNLNISIDQNFCIRMTGNVRQIAEGTLSPELISELMHP